MKFAMQIVCALALIALVGCSTTLATHEFNPAIDFDGYKTFSWVSSHPLVAAPAGANPVLEDQIEQATRDLLTAKGYRFADNDEKADFVVGFGLGATDQARIDRYPAAYRGGWHWPPPAGNQEGNVRQFIEGRLTVDIFDVATHQPAWVGWATKNITAIKGDARPVIRDSLTAILAHFPPS